MKFLGFFMILGNACMAISMISAMAEGVMPGLAMAIAVINLVLCCGIVYGVGKWWCDKTQTIWLIRGLQANVGQSLMSCIVLCMNATALQEASVESLQKQIDAAETDGAEQSMIDSLEQAKLFAEEHNVLFGFVLSFGIVGLIIASYWVYEAKDYHGKQENAKTAMSG